jgi:lysophospholipase
MTRKILGQMSFCIVGLISLTAHAIPESQLMARLTSQILPWIEPMTKNPPFSGVAGVPIHYIVVKSPNPRGVIILSPGQGEPALKYAELMYDMRDRGFTIFAIDHRGQGDSGRLLPDPIKSHVEKFSDYVDDFENFVLNIVHPENYRSSFILSHSMGGPIAGGFMARHPKAVTGAIFSAPMMEINTHFFNAFGLIPDALTEEGAIKYGQFLDTIGKGHDYAPGQTPYNPNENPATNTTTNSIPRFSMKQTILRIHPEMQVGGTTVHWAKESLQYTRALRVTRNVFQVPTIMFQAGQDNLVLPEGEQEICTLNSADFCKLMRFPDARHEILMEKDSIRDLAMQIINQFLDANSPK